MTVRVEQGGGIGQAHGAAHVNPPVHSAFSSKNPTSFSYVPGEKRKKIVFQAATQEFQAEKSGIPGEQSVRSKTNFSETARSTTENFGFEETRRLEEESEKRKFDRH